MQVVCGAGGGLGEETAVAMADRGATVVVNDLGATVDGEGDDRWGALTEGVETTRLDPGY